MVPLISYLYRSLITLFADNPQFYTEYMVRDTKTGYTYSDKLNIRILDLSRIVYGEQQLESGVEGISPELIKWAKIFRAETMDELECMAEGEEVSMSKTIVLFNGELDTLNVFTDQLGKGFKALGYDIYMFDLTQSVNSLGNLYSYIQNSSADSPITAMIGINNAFFGLKTASGVSVWEQLGIPSLNIFVDHPFWYRDILVNMPSNSMAICIDRNHSNFINRFYPQIGGSGFLAHGGTPSILTRAEGPEGDSIASEALLRPLKERNIDVLYAGSLYADQKYIQKPDKSKWFFPVEKICDDTIEYLLENRQETIEDVIEQKLKDNGIILDENELCEFISDCVYIERIISSHFREKIIASVARSGIELDLYGNGWEKCDWVNLPNVHFRGLIFPEEVLDKMTDAKIVLNTLPWFKDGSHERVYNGMLRGCIVVSEESVFLRETIPDDAWRPFDISDAGIEGVPEMIKGLLGNIDASLDSDNNAQQIADNGYNFALNGNTWQDRANEIHEAVLQYL